MRRVPGEIRRRSEAAIFAYGEARRAWGRWGDDDEKGTLNHLTPERRVAAAAMIRTGQVFPLGLPLKSGVGPQNGMMGRFNPIHVMTHTGNESAGLPLGGGAEPTDDMLIMPTQGSTQWDALCHMYYGDMLYNGVPAASVSVHGAAKNGIDKVHGDFVGRGILLDVARWHGLEILPADRSISADDLDAVAAAEGVEVRPGDIVLIRTGAMTVVDGDDWSRFGTTAAGLDYRTAEWFERHRVAAVAADTLAVEGPSPLPGVASPLHMVMIRDMGMHLGELWWLEDLADDCADDGVYEFFLAAQALRIVGGAGSPVNPVAVK
ncbi:cyclase family protein [Tomitella fengzijianii]|uniref:Cyclase family protein n=1 Tax=Tomitella fengzijianii TaxID=2597660 RepID=A0A516X2B6_9ACTN|nr:cyclase family protein [Tomitella fengzijianii]QDQ97224.1 cyclase family protein [Tomitella fengzijianii]